MKYSSMLNKQRASDDDDDDDDDGLMQQRVYDMPPSSSDDEDDDEDDDEENDEDQGHGHSIAPVVHEDTKPQTAFQNKIKIKADVINVDDI